MKYSLLSWDVQFYKCKHIGENKIQQIHREVRTSEIGDPYYILRGHKRRIFFFLQILTIGFPYRELILFQERKKKKNPFLKPSIILP